MEECIIRRVYIELEECRIGRVYDWKGVGLECVILWITSDLNIFEFFEFIPTKVIITNI